MAPLGALLAGAMTPAGMIGPAGWATTAGQFTGAMLPYAAETALIGGVGLAAVGQLGAAGAMAEQAAMQAALSEYNARLQDREAEQIEAETLFARRRQLREASRIGGTLRAAIGASGLIPTEGTPLLIQSRQAAESELENLLIGYEGQAGAQRALSQGVLDRLQAGFYRRQAGAARTAGWIGAGSTLLTGLGVFSGRKYGYGY